MLCEDLLTFGHGELLLPARGQTKPVGAGSVTRASRLFVTNRRQRRDPRSHHLRAAQSVRPLAKAGREPEEGALCARTAAARNTPTERQAQPSGPPRPAQPASGGPPARAAQRARRAAPRRYTGGAAPHVGSVLRAVNVADSSDVAFAAEYTAFGEQTVTTGNADFVPFGFAGGLSDAQTGLVRFGARDYDPSVGRWTSKDPILFDGGQANLYVYVNNDPVNLTDPEGRAVPPWVWTIPFWDGPEPGPADLAAAVLLVCIAAADILDAPISDAERCEQEWAAANRKCGGLIVDSSEEARRLRGGYSNVYDCAKGHVTKDCGGNLIDYGPKRRRRVFR